MRKLFIVSAVLIVAAAGNIFAAEAPASWEFSPDGREAVCLFEDKTARIFSAATGLEIRTIYGYADSTPDLSYSGASLTLWETATGRVLRFFTGHTDNVWLALFSPDGGRALSYTGTEMKLWDTATGQEIRTFRGHVGRVDGALFSPDGSQVLSRSGDGTIKLWNIATGREILTQSWGDRDSSIFYEYYLSHQEFGPDGRQVFTMFNWFYGVGEYKIWDAAAGREIQTFTSTMGLRFSPGRKQLLSVTGAEPYNELKLLDATTGRELRTFRAVSEFEVNSVGAVEFSPDGKQILVGYGDGNDATLEIKLWETAAGREKYRGSFQP